jgi:hypothetical protein
MHPGLWKLQGLRVRGALRRMVRGLKTLRGVLLTIAALGMIALWLGGPLLQAHSGARMDPTAARAALPWILLTMWLAQFLLSGSSKAITFTAPEVDFLFAGPFRRRELLVYKLVAVGISSIAAAVLMATAFLQWVTYWVAAAAGIWLLLLFFQLLDMSLTLTAQWVGEVAWSRARKAILAMVAVLLLAALLQAAISGGRSFGDLAGSLRSSWAGAAVVAPFNVFSRMITAASLTGELPLWGGTAITIDLLLLVVVLGLDANYLEAAALASQKRYEALQRLRSGGTLSGGVKAARWRVPQFAWWGGAGPIGWRQALQLLRSRAIVGALVFMAVFVGFSLISRSSGTDKPESDEGAWAPFLVMLVTMNLVIVMSASFGFRADLDRMDWLKMLPIRPAAIVIGQTGPQIALLSVIDALVLGVLGTVSQQPPLVTAIGLVLVIPVASLLVTLESFMFLIFPGRDASVQLGDPQAYGRFVVLFMLRMLIMALCGGLAVVAALLVYFLVLPSMSVATLVAALVLLAEAAVFLLAAAGAFRRFDVSVDTPAA